MRLSSRRLRLLSFWSRPSPWTDPCAPGTLGPPPTNLRIHRPEGAREEKGASCTGAAGPKPEIHREAIGDGKLLHDEAALIEYAILAYAPVESHRGGLRQEAAADYVKEHGQGYGIERAVSGASDKVGKG
jgi:hypothetical protein